MLNSKSGEQSRSRLASLLSFAEARAARSWANVSSVFLRDGVSTDSERREFDVLGPRATAVSVIVSFWFRAVPSLGQIRQHSALLRFLCVSSHNQRLG